MNIEKLNSWFPGLTGPLIIAGPCSAESEEQCLMIAKKLKAANQTHLFRAGVWKPRTRPNSFEGIGVKALPWLDRVRKETGLPITIEVANAQHAELALMFGVDVLWIGARTTVNPFAVQEIADVLRGVDVPVLVKNPINADLSLWMGALERMNQVGITKLGAIHRGFSTMNTKKYRNEPLWQLPIELKRRLPDLPLICDPSHISGARDRIAAVSQKAMDIDFDGLMIETHITPDQALSDPAQQVTPEQLKIILDNLSYKTEFCPNKTFEEELDDLRHKIDRIDQELLHNLQLRMDIVDLIGKAKALNNVTALQKSRMSQLMKQRMIWAKEMDLQEEFAEKIFDVIHAESVKIQTEITKK